MITRQVQGGRNTLFFLGSCQTCGAHNYQNARVCLKGIGRGQATRKGCVFGNRVFTRRKKVNGYDCTLPVDVCSYSSALFSAVRSRHKKCTGIFTLNFNILFLCFQGLGVSLSHVLLMLCVKWYGVLVCRKKANTAPIRIYTRENHENHARRTKRAIFFKIVGVGN